jgi:hypothetical protein
MTGDALDQARVTAALHDVKRDVEAQLRAEMPRLKALVWVDPEQWGVADRLLVRAALHYLLGRLEDDWTPTR